MADQEAAPLLDSRDETWVSGLPRPLRAICAAGLYAYIFLGRGYGLVGLSALIIGSVVTVVVSLFFGWFAGCASMVLGFASCFCFGAGNAARGKYELSAPVLLASLLLVASGILGSHFFDMYAKTAAGANIGSKKSPVSVNALPPSTDHLKGAHIYMSDGHVDTKFTGEYKWCKDRLPVIGTCVNRFFCVAPIVAQTNFSTGGTVMAWAGVEWTTSCYGVHFQHAPDRLAWDHDYKRGVGFLSNKHWDKAVSSAVKKYSLVNGADAPLMKWVEDPTANQDYAFGMGWFIEILTVCLFIFILSLYNFCGGNTKSAMPEAMKMLNGPDDPTWVRYRQRLRSSRLNATV